MWNPQKSVRLSLFLTYLFLVLLVAGSIALPWIVTWYVEIRGRSPSLPTTIMLTCYPCVPFAAAALWSLKNLLGSILKNEIFTEKNALMLRRISWCCFAVMAIMLFSGRYYLPFYVCAICAAFLGLILRVMRNIIHAGIPAAPEKEAGAEDGGNKADSAPADAAGAAEDAGEPENAEKI